MKIHAVICVFNAVETIEKTLDSLLGKVDVIIIVDNKWIGFEDGTKFINSYDGTIDKIMEWGLKHRDEVFLRYFLVHKRMHQYEARNFALKFVPEGDWVFVIDSDEYVVEWDEKIREKLASTNHRGFRIFERGNIPVPTFRLYRKINGIHYTKNHRYMNDGDGTPVFTSDFPPIQIRVQHLPEAKTKRMRPFMEKYEEWLFEWENKHKKDWAVNS